MDRPPDDRLRIRLPRGHGPDPTRKPAPVRRSKSRRGPGPGARRMTTLVTGATGLLGWHVAELLVARGLPTRALVRPGRAADQAHRLNGLDRANLEVCAADLRDTAALEAAVRGVRNVLHCAARTGP